MKQKKNRAQIKKRTVKTTSNKKKSPKKSQKGVKKTAIRRKALLELIKEVGLYSINKLQFSKLHGVDHKQIDKDIYHLMPQLDEVDMIREKINLREANKLALKAVIEGLDDEDYIQAARAVGYITEKITKHFESYGDKEKVADKQDIIFDGKLNTSLSEEERKELLKELVKEIK